MVSNAGSGPDPSERSTLASGRGLHEILRAILKTITRLPWLHANAGGVFLADPVDHQLELAAHVNFTPQIEGTCTRVAYGHCLCGQVAESGKLLHVGCVDHRHETRYPGMEDHGHYVVPIKDSGELLGILTLYVEAGHAFQQNEADALLDFAEVLASIIQADRQRRDKVLADLVVENSRHGVMICDRQKRILWVNHAFEEITGYRLNEVKGRTPGVLSSGIHDASFYTRMWTTIGNTGQWQGEIWNRRKSGEPYPEWLNIVALRDESGAIERYAGMFVDLSEIRRAEERIHRLAYYDELTGLPNRTWFTERFAALAEDASARGATLYVMVLDLDHFHEINDALGRGAGDALLREAGRRLDETVSAASGMLARSERDQFIVAFCEKPDEGRTAPWKSFAEACLRTLKGEFEHGAQVLQLSATAGLTEYRQGDTIETLLGRAGQALRQAKRQSRGRMRMFDDALGRAAAYDHHILLNIGYAVGRKEFFLVYQPQLDGNGLLAGAEVLLRWDSPGAGLIPPDRFIRHAEQRGAIGPIGRWVFERAIQRLASWRGSKWLDEEVFVLSVNLSPAQLIGGRALDTFVKACERHGVPPGMIELEITETAVMQASDMIGAELDALVEHGFRIAIDDFGTGHSSLARLHEFPIDTFKIDRGFITRLERGGKHLAIVKSMVAMAHELGHDVVAEGVENEEQFDILRNLGCERFQGYLFSRPLRGPDFESYAQRISITDHASRGNLLLGPPQSTNR